MTRSAKPLLVAILLLALSACGGDDDFDYGLSSGSTSRSFTRTESVVTVTPNLGAGFTATQVITVSNDDAGVTRAEVTLVNQVGSIDSSVSPGGYQIQVTLRADAPSEAGARQALATMTVEHSDSVADSTLSLGNEVKFASYSASGVSRSAAVTAALPGTLGYDLSQSIGTGTLDSSGLTGPRVEFHDGAGDSTLSGTWDVANIDAGTGAITVSGDIAVLAAATGTGSVQATLPCTRSTYATLDGSVGNVDVTVTRTAGSGFGLDAQTQVGTASVVVAGTDPVGTQTPTHANYRSADYATSNPQISVFARTSNGDASIHE